MSPLRRVVIGGPQGVAPEDYDEDALRDDDAIILDPDAWDAAERERLLAADFEAEEERAARKRDRDFWGRDPEGGEDEDAEQRDGDLKPVGDDPHRKKGTRREVSGRNPSAPRYTDDDIEIWRGDDADHDAGALRLRRSLSIEEDWETEALISQRNAWLKANDPHLAMEGVQAEISQAVGLAGTSLEEVRSFAFTNGKPNAAARALRAKVRTALLPMYEDGRRRVLIAKVLGCSTQALHKLMTSRSKP